jgi:hypothetical protein
VAVVINNGHVFGRVMIQADRCLVQQQEIII